MFSSWQALNIAAASLEDALRKHAPRLTWKVWHDTDMLQGGYKEPEVLVVVCTYGKNLTTSTVLTPAAYQWLPQIGLVKRLTSNAAHNLARYLIGKDEHDSLKAP